MFPASSIACETLVMVGADPLRLNLEVAILGDGNPSFINRRFSVAALYYGVYTLFLLFHAILKRIIRICYRKESLNLCTCNASLQRNATGDLFNQLSEMAGGDSLSVFVSFFEIYGGHCQDLLNDRWDRSSFFWILSFCLTTGLCLAQEAFVVRPKHCSTCSVHGLGVIFRRLGPRSCLILLAT